MPADVHCVSCGTTNTPMWRGGPAGPKSLCNACGLRWKKGGLKLDEGGLSDPDLTTRSSSSSAGSHAAEKVKEKVALSKQNVPSKQTEKSSRASSKDKRETSVAGGGNSKVASGRILKKVHDHQGKRSRERETVSFAPEPKPKKMVFVDLDRYECLFSGLMVVNKFKQLV